MAELSDKGLKISIWWLNHKHQLKKWWVILLVAGDVLLWFYLLFNILFFVFTWSKFTLLPFQIGQPLIDFKNYQQVNATQSIQVITTKAISNLEKANSYHLISKLKNPNNKWAVNPLVFHFVLNGKNLGERRSFLLPEEERFVIQYNAESDKAMPTPQLVIDEINWQRVERPEKLPSLDFEIKNIKTDLIPLKEKENISSQGYYTRVTADIKNKSLFNYRQIKFLVVLYRGSMEAAASEVTVENIISQEERKLEVSWKEAYAGVSQVVIEPEVNVLDPNAIFETKEGELTPLF